MTFNLNYYGVKRGPWPVRKELIRETIQSADADIIALQAVCRDPAREHGLDQASQLADLLPEYRHVVFVPAMDFPDGSEGGSGILSRLRIGESDHLELSLLPRLEDTNQRVLMHARFDLPAGPLHLFNAHFSWVAEQARLNIGETIPFINFFRGPAVLVGDLNTPSDSDLLQRFSQAGWSDVWAELHPDEQGTTFESNDPSLRIDYAWVNQELKPNVQEIKIVADIQHESGARPSDHFGLLVTLDLEV
jgi:endonuclease/exonuclease/phosphatase family metal-dependent hydrolase